MMMTEATAASDAATSNAPRWHACHTRPRCEKKFARLLESAGFEHYLPLVTSIRRYRTQKKRFTKPLFPGYVFARLEAGCKPRIYEGDLLVRTFAPPSEKAFLRQLADVKRIVDSGVEVRLHPPMAKGTRVRIMGGPLFGTEGIVDNPSSPHGVVISIDVLQQGVLVPISEEELEVL